MKIACETLLVVELRERVSTLFFVSGFAGYNRSAIAGKLFFRFFRVSGGRLPREAERR